MGDNVTEKEKRLRFLIERHNMRVKIFNEFCWADKRVISDFEKFSKETMEIMEEINELKKDPNLILKKDLNDGKWYAREDKS